MERVDRTHPAQNHRCIQSRVDPAQTANAMVSENTDSQSDANYKKREQQMPSDASRELSAA